MATDLHKGHKMAKNASKPRRGRHRRPPKHAGVAGDTIRGSATELLKASEWGLKPIEKRARISTRIEN